jgi:hypothetical protein
MNFSGFPVFNFNPVRFEEYLDNLPLTKKVDYLETVQNHIEAALLVGEKVSPDFVDVFYARAEKFTLFLRGIREVKTREEATDDELSWYPYFGYDVALLKNYITSLKSLEGLALYTIDGLTRLPLTNKPGLNISNAFKSEFVKLVATTKANLTTRMTDEKSKD